MFLIFSLLDFTDFSIWLPIQLFTHVYKIFVNFFGTSTPLTLLEICKIYKFDYFFVAMDVVI